MIDAQRITGFFAPEYPEQDEDPNGNELIHGETVVVWLDDIHGGHYYAKDGLDGCAVLEAMGYPAQTAEQPIRDRNGLTIMPGFIFYDVDGTILDEVDADDRDTVLGVLEIDDETYY